MDDVYNLVAKVDARAAVKRGAVIKMLRRMGQRVPEDVQVIGYDGLRAFGDQDYYCSTIIQPVEAMAETCVELVLGEPNPNTPSLLCLPVRYAYGGTTKA